MDRGWGCVTLNGLGERVRTNAEGVADATKGVVSASSAFGVWPKRATSVLSVRTETLLWREIAAAGNIRLVRCWASERGVGGSESRGNAVGVVVKCLRD